MSFVHEYRNFVKGKVTTQKSLVQKSWIILYFYSDYYIPIIETQAFCLPPVYILVKKHCSGKCHDMFVSQKNKYDYKYTNNYV